MAVTFFRPSGGEFPFNPDSPAFARLEDAVAWCREQDYDEGDPPRDRWVTRITLPDLKPEGPTDIEEAIVWRLDATTGIEWDEATFAEVWAAHADRMIVDYGPEWSAERGIPYPPSRFEDRSSTALRR